MITKLVDRELLEYRREGVREWAKLLYQHEYRWGNWGSLSAEDEAKYADIILDVVANESRGHRGLFLYALILSDSEQFFWNILKPFRRFILFLRGRK